jgi:sporulation protein YlmC with PRC-barrel domain
MLLSDITGLRVISKATAEELGTVERMVIDPQASHIVGIHVTGRKLSKLVGWESVTVGPDAVILESEEQLHQPADEREHAAVKGQFDLIGKLVLSDRGNSCGPAHDVDFDPVTGAIESIETDQGTVEGERLRVVGSYAVIVEAREGAPLGGL